MKLNKLQRKSSIPLSVKKEKPERTNFNNIKHTQKLLKEETTLLNSNIFVLNVLIFKLNFFCRINLSDCLSGTATDRIIIKINSNTLKLKNIFS